MYLALKSTYFDSSYRVKRRSFDGFRKINEPELEIEQEV